MSVRDDQLDTLKVNGEDYEYYRICRSAGHRSSAVFVEGSR